ncbi:MAG: phospholipid carrier-dependent glycosyltransferase [Kiritimatiellia bacterium]
MKSKLPSFATPSLHPALAMALVLAVFAAGLLTIMPNLQAYFFGDEHFYTDSALRMHESGRLLVPEYADGAPRFNKPILSYWLILAGFHTFGISVFASRVASLATGLGILALSYFLTLRLFKSRAAAFLSVLILASNIALITASMRATPDVFLGFSTLLSLYGFAGLLLQDTPRRRDAWYAYLGMGLAIAAKGMLGVLLLSFVLIFALLSPGHRLRLRRLFRPVPLLLGLLLGLFWFIAVYIKMGHTALSGFVNDQVGNRTAASLSQVAANLWRYSFGLALPFFPWSLVLLAALASARPALKQTIREHAPAFLFVIGWHLLLLIIFSPANLTRSRYLLPGYPLIAAGLAFLLSETIDRHPPLETFIRRLLGLLALLLVAGGLLFGLAAWQLKESTLGAAGGIFLLMAASFSGGMRRAPPGRLPVLLALMTFLILWNVHLLIRPAFPSTPSYAMVEELRRNGAARVFYPRQTASLSREEKNFYKEKYASQIRLLSGGEIQVDRISLARYLSVGRARPIVCFADHLHLFPPEQFTATRTGGVYADIGPAEIRRVLAASDKAAALNALVIPYYIVFPKTPAAAPEPARPADPPETKASP